MIHNHIGIRKIFHYVSKVIRDCRVLALLRYVIGPGNLALLSQPIRLITKANLDVVSRVFCFGLFWIRILVGSSWYFPSCDCFGFSVEKHPYARSHVIGPDIWHHPLNQSETMGDLINHNPVFTAISMCYFNLKSHCRRLIFAARYSNQLRWWSQENLV